MADPPEKGVRLVPWVPISNIFAKTAPKASVKEASVYLIKVASTPAISELRSTTAPLILRKVDGKKSISDGNRPKDLGEEAAPYLEI